MHCVARRQQATEPWLGHARRRHDTDQTRTTQGSDQMSADAESTTYDVVDPRRRQRRLRRALRAAELGLSRRPDREGQARRHLPALRLHPDQGAAARRRGRRRRPRGRAVRRQDRPSSGIDMAGVNAYKDGIVAGSTRACRVWSRRAGSPRRGRGQARRPEHRRGRRRPYIGKQRRPGHRLLLRSRCPAWRSAAGSSPATRR